MIGPSRRAVVVDNNLGDSGISSCRDQTRVKGLSHSRPGGQAISQQKDTEAKR